MGRGEDLESIIALVDFELAREISKKRSYFWSTIEVGCGVFVMVAPLLFDVFLEHGDLSVDHSIGTAYAILMIILWLFGTGLLILLEKKCFVELRHFNLNDLRDYT